MRRPEELEVGPEHVHAQPRDAHRAPRCVRRAAAATCRCGGLANRLIRLAWQLPEARVDQADDDLGTLRPPHTHTGNSKREVIDMFGLLARANCPTAQLPTHPFGPLGSQARPIKQAYTHLVQDVLQDGVVRVVHVRAGCRALRAGAPRHQGKSRHTHSA